MSCQKSHLWCWSLSRALLLFSSGHSAFYFRSGELSDLPLCYDVSPDIIKYPFCRQIEAITCERCDFIKCALDFQTKWLHSVSVSSSYHADSTLILRKESRWVCKKENLNKRGTRDAWKVPVSSTPVLIIFPFCGINRLCRPVSSHYSRSLIEASAPTQPVPLFTVTACSLPSIEAERECVQSRHSYR